MSNHQRFHFISGLPRSGSTLLSAILRQNPRFHAGMTSPVGSLFNCLLEQISAGSEFGPVVSHEQRRRLLGGLFDSYYADKPNDSVIFDTNRMWTAKLPAIHDLFPDAKVIACVRNVAWVMDSIERLYRANPYENTLLFSDAVERNTVYSRVDTLGQRNRLVGYAWCSLKEAFYGEHARSMLVVDYDLLAQAPEQVLRLVYKFLGEPWFEGHNFNQLEFDALEFDTNLGVASLHKVRPKVTFEPRPTLLPPDLFEQYNHMSFWLDAANSAANVITAAKPASSIDKPENSIHKPENSLATPDVSLNKSISAPSTPIGSPNKPMSAPNKTAPQIRPSAADASVASALANPLLSES